jgi:dienelactone hydrolase
MHRFLLGRRHDQPGGGELSQPRCGGALLWQPAQNRRGPYFKAPLLIHYAENDQRINAGIEAFEKALKENNKEFQSFIYPGTGHGFNNDSAPQRYHEQAAKLAWSRTVTFFREKLK